MADGLARRTTARVIAAGVDISGDIAPFLESLNYTDNEEDESDDLQLVLCDHGGVLMEHWFCGQSGEPTQNSGGTERWVVCSATGAFLRAGRGAQYAASAELPYGTVVELLENDGGWARVRHAGTVGYVMSDCVARESSGAAGFIVGDQVTVTGTPQYTSYGEGRPGDPVTDYRGEVTHINDKGAPYPIHVGYLGWFAAGDVRKRGYAATGTGTAGAAARSVGGSLLGGVTKGLRVAAAILAENGVMDCGQFELDNVSAGGPPTRITLKCTALPYDSSIRQTDKSKAWENYTLRGIAQEIAGKNGMACVFTGGKDPFYERVEQYQQSDIAFLKKLCEDAGCSLKIYNNIVNVIDKEWIAAQAPVFHIDRNGSNYIKYSLKTGKTEKYKDCEVKWTKADGECIVGTAQADGGGKDGQTLRITQRVESVAEADALAAEQLLLHNKMELSASFTLMGTPALCAGIAVSISGFGDWNGKYIVRQARHSISGSGYTTQIELRKV